MGRRSTGHLLRELDKLVSDPAALRYWQDLREVCWRVRRRCEPVGDCLIFRGALDRGYGRIKVYGRAYMAHRAIYDQAHGITPSWERVSHTCGERACCALRHLVKRSQGECMRAVFGEPSPVFSDPQLRMLRAMRERGTIRPYRQQWSTLWSLKGRGLVHLAPSCRYRLSQAGEDVLELLEAT